MVKRTVLVQGTLRTLDKTVALVEKRKTRRKSERRGDGVNRRCVFTKFKWTNAH